jgi:hypothetical protein
MAYVDSADSAEITGEFSQYSKSDNYNQRPRNDGYSDQRTGQGPSRPKNRYNQIADALELAITASAAFVSSDVPNARWSYLSVSISGKLPGRPGGIAAGAGIYSDSLSGMVGGYSYIGPAPIVQGWSLNFARGKDGESTRTLHQYFTWSQHPIKVPPNLAPRFARIFQRYVVRSRYSSVNGRRVQPFLILWQPVRQLDGCEH